MEACPDPHMQLMLGDGEKKKTPIILIKMQVCQKSSPDAAEADDVEYPLSNPCPLGDIST